MWHECFEPPVAYKQFPLIGEIKGIVHRDDSRNPTERFAYYEVELSRSQEVVCPFPLNCVVAPGLNGSPSEEEPVYHIGEQVVIAFRQGDHGLPFILCRYVDMLETEGGQYSHEYPRHYKKRNHLVEIVDKNGTKYERQVKGQSIQIRDENNKVRVKYTEGGANEIYNAAGGIQARYNADGSSEILDGNGTVRVVVKANGDVELGDTGALHKLIDERAAAIFNNHVHIAPPGASGGPTSTPAQAPSPLAVPVPPGTEAKIDTTQMTTKTKAS